MTSFVRTIPQDEEAGHIEEILTRLDHYIPLKVRPKRARPGDFIYLAYRGRIVGRATIDNIISTDSDFPIGADQNSYQARFLIKYRGGWQQPPQPIPFRGYLGIRYLDRMRLQHLDLEHW